WHWNPDGTFLSQTLRRRPRQRGTLRLIPRRLALMAAQRHTAASRSTSPLIKLQQGFTGGFPILSLSNEPSTSAQTPNFSTSIGHFPPPDGVGVGVGFGFGFGFGLGVGQPPPQAETMEKKRRLSARKRARAELVLEAIDSVIECDSKSLMT
ncbi:hypothetical protein LINPERHAP1_LOCUS3307, partial [Linum perenne]